VDDIEAKDEEVGAWFRGLGAPNPRVEPLPLPSRVLNVIRKEMFNNEQLLLINVDDVRDPAEARDAQKLVAHMVDARKPEEEKIALIVQKPLVSHKCFTAVRYGVRYKDIGALDVKDDVMDRD
jgi:hypothetical protein